MVKIKPLEVIWSKRSLSQLQDIYTYIEKESPKGAIKVVNAVVSRINSLGEKAMMFEADRFKKNNDGSYRAIPVYTYRIVYKIKLNQVHILKIHHTSRLPKKY
jgi:plasmid stabilization system protein ParE